MDKFFGLDHPATVEGMEVLVTAQNEVELSVLRSILEGEKIPYLQKDRGCGSTMRIIAGFAMHGTDLFVFKEDLARAQEVLDAYRNAEPIEDTADAEGTEEEEE